MIKIINKSTVLLIAIFLLVFSCVGNSEFEANPFKSLKVLTPDLQRFELNDILKNPVDLHPSSDIFKWYVIDRGATRPISLIDVKNKKILLEFGEKGEGMGELSSPNDIVGPNLTTPDSLYVFDKFKSKINVYNDSFQFVRQISLDFDGVFSEIKRISDRSFLLSTDFGSKQFAILNLDESILRLPEFEISCPSFVGEFDVPKEVHAELCTAITAFDPITGKYFLANKDFDAIQTYNSDGLKDDELRGPDMIKPSGTVDNSGYYVSYENNVIRGYSFPGFTHGEYLIFGYSGQKMDPKANSDTKWFRAKELIIFSTSTSQPLARIDLGEVYFSRTHFDPLSKILYILDVNPDKEGGDIVYFDLGKVLDGL